MKKYILGAVFSLALLASPAFTQAAGLTSAQVNAIISLLQSFGADSATIASVATALSGGGTRPWCHTFNTDLTVGSSGDDISALHQAIVLSNILQQSPVNASFFDETMAGYVVKFQAKYGIRQTGYVGPITRAKLNALYGCHAQYATAATSDASDAPFSIVAAPNKLQLTVPNNGEKWQIGSMHTIQWTPYDPQNAINVVPTVSAYLERQVNGSFVTVGKVQEDGKASIHWSGGIGDTPQQHKFADPGEYYIRIVNSQTGEWDRSDVPFTLVAQNTIKADLKINGLDTSWDAPLALSVSDVEVTLSWTSNADKCKLYFNGLANDLIDLSPSGQQNVFLKQNPYTYTASIFLSCDNQIGSAGDAVYIASVNADSKITVMSPNGGEAISYSSSLAGSSSVYPITWTSSKDIANVSIALYKNDAFYRWIVANSYPVQSANGSLSWALAKTISDSDVGAGAVFKIYMIGYKTSGGTVEDKSDAPFSIVAAPIVSTPISSNGNISQKLHHVQSSNSFYGIGSDNAIWKWDNSSKQWSRITDGSVKDDFHFISESDIYAIGLDNQIWHWNGIRWNQVSEGGKIQQKIWYVDGNHVYGIGMDNQIWRWGSAGGWVKITSNGQIKDDFHFVSENDIYGIGLDGQIWRWHGSGWSQISSGGVVKQKLRFVSANNIWGIGADNKIWKWNGGSWQQMYDAGQVKDDFVLDGSATYGIGLDNQIWEFAGSAALGFGKSSNDTVGSAYSNPGLASVLGAFSGNGEGGKPGNVNLIPLSTSSFSYVWNRDLQIGSPYSDDIAALQQALAREGVYGGEITGGFYNQTYAAVQAFQRKYAINPTGYVGLLTRSKLNAFY